MLHVGDLVKVRKGYKGYWDIHNPELEEDGFRVGIVTTVWIDEDDRQASIVDFSNLGGESVFRSHEYRYLEVIGKVG